jgi:hypothetical protein
MIRNIFKISNLTSLRDENNKKKYKLYRLHANQINFNKILSRKFHTSFGKHLSFGKPGGNGPKLPLFTGLLFIYAVSCHISSKYDKPK